MASAADKAAAPDPSKNPAFAALIKAGAKFFYLGRYAGLDGWLAVRDSQIQIVYKPTNNAYALVGYLFAPNGDSVTAGQVKELTASNKDLATLAQSANDLPTPIFGVGGTAPPISPADAAALNQPVTDIFLPAGERLLKELKKASDVALGANAEAPQLFVIASPDCSSCKAFWKGFRDPVQKGNVRLRLFPVASPDGDYQRAAAQLLHATDPFAAWDKYIGGDKSSLAGVPEPAFLDEVRANTALVEKWSLPAIPYLVYRAKDGSVKVVQGAPNQPEAILNDIAPEKSGAKP
jgi:protein-disulfide isomerase